MEGIETMTAGDEALIFNRLFASDRIIEDLIERVETLEDDIRTLKATTSVLADKST